MYNQTRKYCLFVREDLAQKKETFFSSNELYGMKSDLYMYSDLKKHLATTNISLNTQYINHPHESEVIVCVNETDYFVNYKRTLQNRLLVLILTEPPVYNLKDWDENRHQFFDKVFTYNSDLVLKNPIKYKLLAYPIDFDVVKKNQQITEQDFTSKKNSCMIASAFAITKGDKKQKSLLYERYKILVWYNKHAYNKLDYYSRTNPKEKFVYFRGASLLNKISKKIGLGIANYSYSKKIANIYKGAVPSLNKTDTLAQYKFNFCLENSLGVKGYITEKIFDAFFSLTVPIYFGAKDAHNYIPNECYINYSEFKSIHDLHKYLINMDYKTYVNYQINITNFLNSTAVDFFSVKKFVNTLELELA